MPHHHAVHMHSPNIITVDFKRTIKPKSKYHRNVYDPISQVPFHLCATMAYKNLVEEFDFTNGEAVWSIWSISATFSELIERSALFAMLYPCVGDGAADLKEDSLFYKTFGRQPGSLRSHCRVPRPLTPPCPDAFPTGNRILSPANIRDMHDAGALPRYLKGMAWKTIFSTERDGSSFQTFMKNIAGRSPTIIVGQSAGREILGGFVDSPWVKKPLPTSPSGHFEAYRSGFHGSGKAFLFEVVDRKIREHAGGTASRSRDGGDGGGRDDGETSERGSLMTATSDGASVNVFPWTGANTFVQLCDPASCRVAMGGGCHGEFGLCFDDNFQTGSSGACDTFGNWRPLVSSEGVSESFFDLIGVEVYCAFTDDSL
mmetsp:Transcript_16113/g.24523  ORF Transcript_16113/g.24523 Transcript_16113/m.24523 type:complete len:372 (-) Transcript_16113:305-1420(-)